MIIRTRFAPSPTGFMHIGNLRTAIFEYLLAKSNDGKFILRIEDTDQSRKVDGAIDFIYDTLKLCNISIDEGPNNNGEYGPYIQSERAKIYKDYALKLVEENHAYYCFCNEERLENLRKIATKNKKPFMYDGHCKKLSKEEVLEKIKNGEKYVIRQKMPKYGKSTYIDQVYGKITIENSVLEDQILLKSDGLPTYNFANVIDDHLMKITHVIRGNEYLSQTPKYNLLYEAFGWQAPTYIHVPMVLGTDGNKLSKRNKDASFMDLYKDGYLPEAIVNYLVLLGWSPNDNQEIFSMNELIKNFDISKISKSPSTYDIKKLQWFNANYIKKMDDEKYYQFVLPYLKEVYDLTTYDKNWIEKLVQIYKNHISYGKQIVEETKMFFDDEFKISEEAINFMQENNTDIVINTFKNKILNIKKWTIENINFAISETKKETNEKGKLLYMPIRIKTTGLMHGPELADTLYLIGKTTVLKRLEDNL